jgi:DNA repair protein RadA/Sms
VARRARRLGVDPATIRFTPGRDLAGMLAAARQERPAVLAVDSIQTLRDPGAPWTPGGVSQVRSATDALVGLAKSEGIAVVISGHVTKDGDLAGPRALEHTVDVVLAFQGDSRSGLRVLAGTKNRFGAEGEQAWFEMTPTGLREIDPSSVLLSREAVPGSAVALPQVGRRAMAVDVQALVGSLEGPARRQVTGLDPRRFQLVAAVLDRVGGLRFARAELFGAVAGGARLDDPACDLAVAIALVSAATGTVAPSGVAFVGEVSLTGSVRPAPGMEARLRAAAAAGCDVVVASTSDDPPHAAGTPRIHRVRDLRQAVSWALPTSISTVRKLPA